MISGNTLTRRRWRDLWWIATALILSAPATAAPKAALWPAHNPHSRAVVDHVPWDRFLKKYVNTGPDGINRVDYAAVTQADKQGLRRYIASLAATPIRGHNREQQFVFWVNLYNAITLHIVLEAYPVASIRDLGVFSSGPWNRELVNVEVRDLTLNDIEHRIVRPIWRDPRTHYAVNCASIGSQW
ncbi:MAG: DUF547 domain-containing protein, partial [Gammaproteobacteria bacterium]|nr:DUF547 domain-containing protein [Gammaproteobacteria bacterium]